VTDTQPNRADVDPRILGQLLAAQSTLSVFSARQRVGEFLRRALEELPGVARCAVCLTGTDQPELEARVVLECKGCEASHPITESAPVHDCSVTEQVGYRGIPVRTREHQFGFFLIQVEEEAVFAPYAPFVENMAGSLAINLERQWQRDQLEEANTELQRHRDHLEDLVQDRTVALQLGLQRERRLNTVLKAVRAVNQLIIREKDEDRLLQEACRILTDVRDFACVMINRLNKKGGVELAAVSIGGAGEVPGGGRSMLEEQPDCCRKALASDTPILRHHRASGCKACPAGGEGRETPCMAMAMRHGEQEYGVLTAALPTEIAQDPDEQALFSEVAGDLAMALHDIELERRHHQLEERLKGAEKMEAIGRLAGGVAHDFNNLLSVILSYTGFAIEELKPSDPIREDIQEIQNAGERAATLTRQLLAFSRKLVLEPKVINLNTVVSNMESMLRRLLGEDIEIVVHLAGGLGSVEADPGQLEQVIMNLAVNARDAMPNGGKLAIETQDTELDEAYASQHASVMPGQYVMLSVTDTGLGMDDETMAHVFEPFFTSKEQGKGTGLGLATVYGIVKQSGGNIWVYSEPGIGATFKVYLPRVEAPAARAVKSRSSGVVASGDETVLIVEDEDGVRRIAERILRGGGYQVLSAANGGEALLLCEKHGGSIDMLLTDVVMPHMSGRELAERLVKDGMPFKVLYMSGYTNNAIVQHGVLEEGTRFISKPFTSAELFRAVREVLDDSA